MIRKITSCNFPSANFYNVPLFIKQLNVTNIGKVVTVTGTNGKGSTVFILSEILAKNKINHVCHISPHVHIFNERISYNQLSISDKTLFSYLKTLYRISNEIKIKLSYHIIGFLCSLMYAKEKKPDWLILEVGIGGKLDPANLINAEIAIITNVALDHCELLGKNRTDIALNKVEIARRNKPVILGEKLPDAAYRKLMEIGAKIILVKKNSENQSYLKNTVVETQNILCALAAAKIINYDLLDVIKDFSHVNIQGRFHQLSKKPLIIVDVAHNRQAIDNLVKKVKRHKQNTKFFTIGIFGAKQEKNIYPFSVTTQDTFDLWILPNLQQLDNSLINWDNNKTSKIFPRNNTIIIQDSTDAFNYVQKNIGTNSILVVFGSFTIVGAYIEYYKKNNK